MSNKEKHVGWTMITNTIIDELIVESEMAVQISDSRIERVIIRKNNSLSETKIEKEGNE